MTFRRSDRVAGIELSEIVQITERAAALKAMGRDVVALSTGEPDFPTPPHVIEAAHQAALAGKTRYTAVDGITEGAFFDASVLRTADGTLYFGGFNGITAFAPAEVRDRVFTLAAPFTGQPTPLIDLKDRYGGVIWGDSDTALVLSRQFNSRRETRYLVDPSNPGQGRTLLERNYQDRYNDPGFPVTEANAGGGAGAGGGEVAEDLK